MIKEKSVTAIILVAGNSTRYGQNRNKNFEIVEGKTILEYSLNAFESHSAIDDMIVVIRESEREDVQRIIQKKNYQKRIQIITGGSTRKESVYHGIRNTKADIVIIHDGARPMIQQRFIDECLENVMKWEGVAVGVKSKDTIKITDENHVVIQTTNRNDTWMTQTPQCFRRETLCMLHEKYQTEEVTDDCMLLEIDHYPVKMVEGDYTNLKITTYEDLLIMKSILGH